MFIVYVLKNSDGLFYKGYTKDLTRRLYQHNHGQSRWTGKRGPWRLVYSEQVQTKQEAMAREKFLKSGQGRLYIQSHIGL